jgi:hypothetical protein
MERYEVPLSRQLLEEWLGKHHPELSGCFVTVQGAQWDFVIDGLRLYVIVEGAKDAEV